MSTELRDGTDSGAFAPGEDLLAYEPKPVDRRVLRALVVAGAVLVLLVIGSVAWQQLRPRPDFTLDQLRQAYASPALSEDTSDVSMVTARNFGAPPLTITPAGCTPLFVSTVSHQFPAPALDGMSATWLQSTIGSTSVFTLRYADSATAAETYSSIEDAAAACDGATVRFSGREGTGQVRAVPVPADGRAPQQVAYRWDRAGGRGRYVLHVLRLSNTVTWQYRYDFSGSEYDPTADQQAMDGAVEALLAVRDGAR